MMNRRASLSLLLHRGLVDQALKYTQSPSLNPNALEVLPSGNAQTLDRPLPLIAIAISYGNVSVLRELLKKGASVSTSTYPTLNPARSLSNVCITVLSLVLQFQMFRTITRVPIFHFAILNIPVELFVWTALRNDEFPSLDGCLPISVVLLYFLVSVLSRTAGRVRLGFGLDGSWIRKATHMYLFSPSIGAYISRRAALGLVHRHVKALLAVPEPVSEHQQPASTPPEILPPGAEALICLFRFSATRVSVGQDTGAPAEEMAMLLLNHGLASELGDPNEKEGFFQGLWTWAVARGYARVAETLLKSVVEPDFRKSAQTMHSTLTALLATKLDVAVSGQDEEEEDFDFMLKEFDLREGEMGDEDDFVYPEMKNPSSSNLSIKTEENRTPKPVHILEFCASEGYIDLTKLLLQYAVLAGSLLDTRGVGTSDAVPAAYPDEPVESLPAPFRSRSEADITSIYPPHLLTNALYACVRNSAAPNEVVTSISSYLLYHGADANGKLAEDIQVCTPTIPSRSSAGRRTPLSWACDLSVNHSLVSLLLAHGAAETINAYDDFTDRRRRTALHHAASKHDAKIRETLAMLVAAGADVNALDGEGNTPLWWAVRSGFPEEVAWFLEQEGVDVDRRGSGRRTTTPLAEACKLSAGNNFISVAMLLACGADPNAETVFESMLSEFEGEDEVEDGKDEGESRIEGPDKDGGNKHITTPLIALFDRQYNEKEREERDDLLGMLLDAGADPAPDACPELPLVRCIACTNGAGEWVHEMLEALEEKYHSNPSSSLDHADPSRPSNIPHFILDAALKKALEATPYMYLDGICALVSRGADPNIRLDPRPWLVPPESGTVLHHVARNEVDHRGSTADTILLLVEHGADVGALEQNREGGAGEGDVGQWTPLHVAVQATNLEAVEELVAQGADINAMAGSSTQRLGSEHCGLTPLSLACRKSPTRWTRYTPFQVLVDGFPDRDDSDGTGVDASNDPERLLHERQRSGKRMGSGLAAAERADRFSIARSSGRLEDIIRFLRTSGADLLAADSDGMTALHYACKAGNPIAVAVLLRLRREDVVNRPTSFRAETSSLLTPASADGIFASNPDSTLRTCSRSAYSTKQLLAARDHRRRTPLHLAVSSGNVEVVRMVLAADLRWESGGEHNIHGDGIGSFHAAFCREIVWAVDDHGHDVLQYIAQDGPVEVLELLLQDVEGFANNVDERTIAILEESVALENTRSITKEILEDRKARKSASTPEFEQYNKRCDFSSGYYPCWTDCSWCKHLVSRVPPQLSCKRRREGGG